MIGKDSCEMNQAGVSRMFGGWNFPPLHQSVFQFRSYDVAKLILDSQRCELTFTGGSYLSMLLMEAYDCTLILPLKFIRLFLEVGCDMENKDRHGNTPFTTLIQGNDDIFDITNMRNLMVLLVRAGIQPSWDELILLQRYIQNDKERKFYDWISSVVSQPRSLLEQCRWQLRHYFGIYPNDRIKQLPLPQKLISYVTLEYLQTLPLLEID